MNDSLREHVPNRDVVSLDELSAPRASTFTEEYSSEDSDDGLIRLLDPIMAELAEQARYRRAPKRRRMTAEDLDREHS